MNDFGRARAPWIPVGVVVGIGIAVFIAGAIGIGYLSTSQRAHLVEPEIRFVPRTHVDAGALFELGKKAARLEAERERVDTEIGRAKTELFELEQVVYFSDCIERRSGKPFEIAFEREKYAKACRAETMSMTPIQISAAAKAIVDGKKRRED